MSLGAAVVSQESCGELDAEGANGVACADCLMTVCLIFGTSLVAHRVEGVLRGTVVVSRVVRCVFVDTVVTSWMC